MSWEFSLHVRDDPDPVKGYRAQIRMADTLKVKVRGVFVCVCMPQLTYVDPAAVTLHQQQDKDVKRNEVDDEDVPAPRRHLWSKPKIGVCNKGNHPAASNRLLAGGTYLPGSEHRS